MEKIFHKNLDESLRLTVQRCRAWTAEVRELKARTLLERERDRAVEKLLISTRCRKFLSKTLSFVVERR